MNLKPYLIALLMMFMVGCQSEVTITETGYTEDGKIDMNTREGDEIFQEDCRKAGIPVDSWPLPDREANTRELMR